MDKFKVGDLVEVLKRTDFADGTYQRKGERYYIKSDEIHFYNHPCNRDNYALVNSLEPRAKTVEEVREEFIRLLYEYAIYWSNVAGKTDRQKLLGLVHSILVIFDGESASFPALDISLSPHSEDKEYHKENGENWYEPGMVINGCYLHDLWSEKLR